jgi:hypothetical protein
MKSEYFDFSKFVDDLERRQTVDRERALGQAELEKNNRTRDLNKLYREHPLSKTYADTGDQNG